MSREDGYQNLVPYQYRSGDEARANGQKGGIESGKSRRRKRSLKEAADLFLSLPVNDDKTYSKMVVAGIDPEDIDYQMAVVVGQTVEAIKGNAKAAKVLVDIIGKEDDQAQDDKPYELPARILGKAFVDINRHIEPNTAYVFEGGRGGLKSSYIGFKVVELQRNNPQLHACITRQVAATLKDSVYAQMKWCITALGLEEEYEFKVSPLEIRYKKTGQTIYFRGLDDETKLKGIKVPFGYIGILWKEEKDQMKGEAQERSVNQSVLRGGDITYDFSSYNPPKSKSAWVNKAKLTPNPNRVIHQSNYLDAPAEWLGQKFLDDAAHLKEVNPAAYEHEYMGVPTGDGGNVFEFLEIREITDEEIAAMDRIHQGVDFGWYPDQYAFLRTHYDAAREKIYLIDELYLPPTQEDAFYTLRHIYYPDRYPLPEEYDFDLNGDGVLDDQDAFMAMDVANGKLAMKDVPGAVKTQVTIIIDMGNPEKPIRIYGKNMWGTEIESFIGPDVYNCSFAAKDYLNSIVRPYKNDAGETYLHFCPLESLSVRLTNIAKPKEPEDAVSLAYLSENFLIQGTANGWTYRKWGSGVAECWCSVSVSNLACDTAWGGVYETAEISLPDFPFPFSSAPVVGLNWEGDRGAITEGIKGLTTTSAGRTLLMRATSRNITGRIMIHATGTWK